MLSRPTLLPVPVKGKSAGSKKKAPAKKAPATKKSGVKSRPSTARSAKARPVKKSAKKAPEKKAPAKKAPAKKVPAKKAPAKKVPAKKAPAKKVPAKKAPAKKAPEKKAPAKKAPAPALKVSTPTAKVEPKVEPKVEAPKITLVVPKGLKPAVPSKPLPPLKPRSEGPRPLVVRAGEEPWSKSELSTLRAELEADLVRLRRELAHAENDIADLLKDSGDGAGDDQADAGTKTFEREHELSLVNNARDMVLQSERALARIADGSYGVCEACGNPIGKARLQVFPRATLCMLCKQKEERR